MKLTKKERKRFVKYLDHKIKDCENKISWLRQIGGLPVSLSAQETWVNTMNSLRLEILKRNLKKKIKEVNK